MHIEELANELLLCIFHSCKGVQDALSLAATNHHFYRVFSGSKKLPILFTLVEAQYGPLEDAIQVVTYNSSQAAHHFRTAPESLPLLKQVLNLGRGASKWVTIYPTKKWRDDFENRRLLRANEAYRLRRAIYRLTLFARAFHNARYPRTSRTVRHVVLERASLLHNWTTAELAELADVWGVLRNVIQSHICPSNGAIRRKFHKRYPDSDHQPFFNVNIHLNYPPPLNTSPTFFQAHFYSTHQRAAVSLSKYVATSEPGGEGWGDEVLHYYVVEDMMKMEPSQVLWLKENAPLKVMVQDFLARSFGEWFENNGETFGQTLEWVLEQRGELVEEVKDGIEHRCLGIIREE